ncbi:hypothetical protein KUTeg_024303 [Tegillarca granosa]|uniref:DUF229 domain containing protein n=1 Tax=Tegillarca granosa TaxID=220873 RepID=A0ABQ9DXN7_TEGGR|nr:hypothetical protein KUTeg_024303 [Tegillarca granosa]
MVYFESLPPLNCYNKPEAIYMDSNGAFRLNKSAVKNYGYSDISCTYSSIERKGNSDSQVIFKPEVKMRFPEYLKSDFALITCSNHELVTVHKQLHSTIDTKTALQKRNLSSESEDRLSVVIFGVDSLSRLTAIRTLNKTLHCLKNDLDGYIFKGQTKVGRNTLPNIIPLMTGRTQASFNVRPPFDFTNVPFIWNNFSRKGYATFFSEDDPDLAVFNSDNDGFQMQPTDHYMRPFYLAMKNINAVSHDNVIDNNLHFLKHIKIGKSSFCYGNLPKHSLLIEYYKTFMTTYAGKCKFAFSWLTELRHNSQKIFRLADNDFSDFLKWLKENKHLENAILIFMGDHGSNFGAIRNTFIGRIEERMPFFSLVLPEHIKRKYPDIHKNLQDNTHRLTTVFDVHETIKDILNKNFIPRKINVENVPRGISLFSKIPRSRTCLQAGIPEQHCACYSSSNISTEDPDVKKFGSIIVNYINKILSDVQQKCHKLTLHEIKHAESILSGFKRVEQAETFTFRRFFSKPDVENVKRYLVLIETIPGNGLFEATVDYKQDGAIDFIGQILRTNTYGNQSRCITNFTYKEYCYCR